MPTVTVIFVTDLEKSDSSGPCTVYFGAIEGQVNREGDSCISFISFMIISNSGSLGSNAAMQT